MKRCAFFWLRQRRDDARLQNAVTTCYASVGCVNVRCVQWVSGNRHQLAQRSRPQAGVAVQRHDVLNAAGQVHAVCKIKRACAVLAGQVVCIGCGNQPHQLFQLAAFALPAYPLALSAAPFAPPVDDQKARCLCLDRRVIGI